MKPKTVLWFVCGCLLSLLLAGITRAGVASAVISVNPSLPYQVMTGWEAAILATVLDYRNYNTPGFSKLLDQAVDDIGMTRLQVGVFPGMENPFDSGSAYLNGTISENTWATTYLYNSVNDNPDPSVLNPNGFHWTILDWEIDNLVLQIKQRVEARGEKLYTYVSYTDYGASPFEHWHTPSEYAEFMLAVFDHMQAKYGFVPDGINVINEPGYKNDWTGTAIGNVIAATGPRLSAAGYHPDFMAPSTVDMGQAPAFFDAIMAVPGARPYLKEISYHRYGQTGGTTSLQNIASRAGAYGMRTVMNEWWSSENTYRTLHQDLKIGRNSSWQQAAIGGVHGYYNVDSSTGQIALTPKSQFLRQYYKFVRPGAQRIEATTSDSTFDPLAFVNKDGSYVTVIKAESAGDLSITNLPAGVYGVFYTTAGASDVQRPDVTLAAGQALSTSIPDIGVITIYKKTAQPASTPFTLPPQGNLSLVPTGVNQPLEVGYARLEGAASGLAVIADRSNGILISEAAVPAANLISNGRIYAESSASVHTGLAMANPHLQAVNVSFYFTDASGLDFAHCSLTLSPNQQLAAFLDERPFSGNCPQQQPVGNARSFTISASMPVAAMSLRGLANERGEFLMTTLPIASLSMLTSEAQVIPHFAQGGGWTTKVILLNPTDGTLRGRLDFFAPTGTLPATQPYVIAAHGAVDMQMASSDPIVQTGSIRIVPQQGALSPVGLSVFSYVLNGITSTQTGVPMVQPGSSLDVYVETSPDLRAGLAVANVTSQRISVDLEVIGANGLSTGVTDTLTLEANGKRSLFLDEIPGALDLPVYFRGLVRFKAAAGSSVVAFGVRQRKNERGEFLISSVVPSPSDIRPGTELYVPHFARGGGYSTQFILFAGASSSPVNGIIRLLSQNGSPLPLSAQ